MFYSQKDSENQKDFTELQPKTLLSKSPEKSKSGLLVYTASELLTEFNGKETDFLWDNLVPRVGTGLLVGQPDLGKSQLAKELAIMLAKGSSEYLGLKLNPIRNHVLYVFTEDQEEGVSSSLHKQLIKHSDLDKSKLSLAFLRDESIVELIKKIDAFCTETPIDLVIIDAFGDVFSGSDSNNNIQMRRDIKAFDDVVRRHNICVLFVHHVNKSGYNKTPSQELIQGGSGLTQKVRFALFLSRNDDGQKFLNVAKGNYSSKYYKENRLPIDFDEETLTFDVNGEWRPIQKSNKKQKSELNDDDLFVIFKDNGLSFNKVISKIIEYLEVSQSTAERRLGKLLTASKITKIDNLYYFTGNINSTTFKSQVLGKNEGEGDILPSGEDADSNTSTINPQILANFEGEGKEYEATLLDEIDPPTVPNNLIQRNNEVESTLNPHDLLEIEGEGELDARDIVNVSSLKIEVVESVTSAIFKKIHEELATTDYTEDEHLHHAIEDFYQKAPDFLKSEEIFHADLEWVLQDMYSLDLRQGRLIVKILLNLNVLWIDDDACIRA